NVTVATPTPPARVQGVQVNDGSAQRSRVTSLTVTFSAVVTLPANAADAFRLVLVGGKPVGLSSTTSVVGGVTQVVLTFDAADTEYSSLHDGNYTLTVLGSQIFNGGGLLDGDGDGAP